MKVILFDIDHTLFNSTGYLAYLYEILEENQKVKGRSQKSAIQEAYSVVRGGEGFDTLAFLRELGKRVEFTVSIEELLNHVANPAVFEKYLYPEVKETLSSLQKSATLGIFSTGNKEMQLAKISSLINLFDADNLFIARDKTELVKHVLHTFQNDTLYIIDDRLDMLELVKKERHDVITIWCKRGNYAEKQAKAQTFFPDETIGSLKAMTNAK